MVELKKIKGLDACVRRLNGRYGARRTLGAAQTRKLLQKFNQNLLRKNIDAIRYC